MKHSIKYRTLGIEAEGNAEGTDAPWEFDRRSCTVRSAHPRRDMRPAGDPFPTVCRMPQTYTPQQVDGHLIAAAPDLYAAAQRAMGTSHSPDCEVLREGECSCHIGLLRAAIAKAQGC